MVSSCLRTAGTALVGVLLLGGCRSAPDTANDCGCATPKIDTEVPSPENRDVVRSLLGKGFGSLMEIEAVVVAMPGDGLPEGELAVLGIDGVLAPSDLRMLWTYGSWKVETVAETGLNGFTVQRDGHYRLRGYETGWWRGLATGGGWDAWGEFGPPQGRSLSFCHCFRLRDGDLIGDSDTHYDRQLYGPKGGWPQRGRERVR